MREENTLLAKWLVENITPDKLQKLQIKFYYKFYFVLYICYQNMKLFY